MSFYLLYKLNHALYTFIIAPELQFKILNPRGKWSKMSIFHHWSKHLFALNFWFFSLEWVWRYAWFQNKAPVVKILKFHVNQDNSAYLEKYNFWQKLVYQFWDCHWICGIETSLWVVSDSDFEARLALHAKWGKL